MLPSILYLSTIFVWLVIVSEPSVTLEKVRAADKGTWRKYHRISEKHSTNNSTDVSKSNIYERLEERRSRLKTAKTAPIFRETKKREMNSNDANEIGDNARRANSKNERKKPIDYFEKQRTRFKQKKKVRILQNKVSRNKTRKYFSSKTMEQLSTDKEQRFQPLNVSCAVSFTNESSLSLRSLFHVPRVHQVKNCSSVRKRVTTRTREEHGPSSAVSNRLIDRGHTDLINQYKKEQSMDDIGVEYVHPEGHNSRSPRKTVLARSVVKNQQRKNVFSINAVYDSNELDYYFLKNKRTVRGVTDDDPGKFSREYEAKEDSLREFEKTPIVEKIRNQMQNSTSHFSLDIHDFDKFNSTENPWPLVPGPISCDLDFQLRPSFVAKLGEFDYVVSVHRQQNPDEPAEHACTGVVYNPRFVVIAPHCLNDDYGLAVTSTDDLCTIDELIGVDYIIEHENYDPETRRNDIALIKLKSEIHKRAAEFPIEDDTLERYFYAVGFGELMWKSFPKRVSKLLQKVPVQRYPWAFKEVPGTLDITTAHMDLTGTFRGDFGGALINRRGEFVGLKSKFVKRSREFEVYTRVRTYLPWIKEMVALHGSW